MQGKNANPLIKTCAVWAKPEVMYDINGDLLREWCAAQKINQATLARALKVSQGLVSGLHQNQWAVNRYLLERLAEILVHDVSRWHELVIEEEDQERSA